MRRFNRVLPVAFAHDPAMSIARASGPSGDGRRRALPPPFPTDYQSSGSSAARERSRRGDAEQPDARTRAARGLLRRLRASPDDRRSRHPSRSMISTSVNGARTRRPGSGRLAKRPGDLGFVVVEPAERRSAGFWAQPTRATSDQGRSTRSAIASVRPSRRHETAFRCSSSESFGVRGLRSDRRPIPASTRRHPRVIPESIAHRSPSGAGNRLDDPRRRPRSRPAPPPASGSTVGIGALGSQSGRPSQAESSAGDRAPAG